MFILSIIFLVYGIMYLYWPDSIHKLNALAIKYLFNDKWVMYRRKKVGVIICVIALILVYLSINMPGGNVMINDTKKEKLYHAYCQYHLGEYDKAEKLYNDVLLEDPVNPVAVKQLCLIYFAGSDYKKAKLYCQRVLSKEPGNIKFRKILEKCAR